MLIGLLYELGCNTGQLNAVKLALGPVQFDGATDRSVLASMTVAKHDLEPYIQIMRMIELIAIISNPTSRD